ncbi:hypothetical protein HF209_30470 [Pseudomonas sp. WS 5096]|uniref:Uncharacterized protein n=1 Tax=Pseudomonas cremoris TaxID=2724178 RepID=A0ABR6TH58_9PSED|nr:hypothetical protein [Pseudomonas cremoris]MBC2385282.1 hypothetical protein [Pseudomonas cremoris]
MSTTFEQSRAAGLDALTQAAEAIRAAPELGELYRLATSALDKLNAAHAHNLISQEEADQWRAKLDAVEDERLAEL